MITCSRHSDIEKETRKQEKMAPLVISPPLSFHYSGGFRGGARGAQTAPPRPYSWQNPPTQPLAPTQKKASTHNRNSYTSRKKEERGEGSKKTRYKPFGKHYLKKPLTLPKTCVSLNKIPHTQ